MFIDTHMHIGDDFGVKPDTYIKNALDNNVKIMIASFCEKKDITLSTKFVDNMIVYMPLLDIIQKKQI